MNHVQVFARRLDVTYSLHSGSVERVHRREPPRRRTPRGLPPWLVVHVVRPHTVPRHRMLTSQRPGAEAPEELLAEEFDSSANEPRSDETIVTRRVRERTSPLPLSQRIAAVASRPKKGRPARSTSAPRTAGRNTKPLRSLVILDDGRRSHRHGRPPRIRRLAPDRGCRHPPAGRSRRRPVAARRLRLHQRRRSCARQLLGHDPG